MKNFNISRVLLLMKKDALENIKTISLGYISVIGVVLFFLLIDAEKVNAHLWINFNQIFQMSIAFVGIVIAGNAFSNFRTKELTTSYLTLPASNTEKTVSQILLVTLGTIISYTLVFFVSQFLFIAIGKAFYTMEIGFFNPFDYDNIKNINRLIVAQSIFIAGASYFKKAPIFKTSAVIFILWMILMGIFSYLMYLTLKDLPENVGLKANLGISTSNINYNSPNLVETGKLWSGQILEVFFTYLLAPILWLVTYFNVKEKEV